MRSLDKQRIIPYALALISGLLLVAVFPKIDQGWVAWFALVPLLLVLRKAGPGVGFRLGLTCGLVHYLGVTYWTAYSMRTYGHLPMVQSIFVLVLLAGILALFTALFALAVCRLNRRPWLFLLVAPAAWTVLEWLRSWVFTGFPWALLGYSQYNRLWLVQVADLFGVYGLSFLIVAANAVLTLALLRWVEKSWHGHEASRALVVRSLVVLPVCLTAAVGYGMLRVKTMDRLAADATPVRVALVQGNVDQSIKWDTTFQMLTTVKYRTLSLQAAEEGVDLIIWPETATPFYLYRDTLLSDMVVQGVRTAGTHFIIGSPRVEIDGDIHRYYNSAYLIDPQGEALDRYDKVHLVPFGEYVPLQRWLSFAGKMVQHVSDFHPGDRGNALMWEDRPIGMLICYEIIFPALSRAMVRNGGQLLVNITNDAWFGRTAAPYQHFAMAVLRSVENRRYLARSANTGISGFIDPCGRILATTELYTDAILTGEVKLLDGLSHYSRWGDWPLMGLCGGLLVLAVGRQRRSAR
ncbi:apolipoprotein N-acyltransferase [Desulfatitalea alkaliphila]|uniref:Apolipoprotein N-acyltransferase n=1 Tax=Desulfatitalea alkaliphila TaxID=2929485 RepID=A0AA41R0Z2_9BACT|nr:apolipoprotein N-acyltransferase [Desulfatitalea alkaliphila]MCJ8500314.1 apolipoprotein N-acyltransferase [Desulfatitalea alkaliphila]